MCEIGINPAFVRFGHQLTPFPRNVRGLRAESESTFATTGHPSTCSSRGCINAAHMSFERSDVALAKAPLPALFECRENVTAGKFVDRVRAQVEQECDLARVEQDIVLVGHYPCRLIAAGHEILRIA